MISSNLAIIILIEVWTYQTFTSKSRMWARSYAKHKGDAAKLSEIRDIIRKVNTKLMVRD
jgi:hypothetical protein